MSFPSNGQALHGPAPEVNTWFTPGKFALILFALLLAVFPDAFLGSHSFFYRDFGIFGYPLAFHHRESFWQGEVPLWNPLNNCGLPFLAALTHGPVSDTPISETKLWRSLALR